MEKNEFEQLDKLLSKMHKELGARFVIACSIIDCYTIGTYCSCGSLIMEKTTHDIEKTVRELQEMMKLKKQETNYRNDYKICWCEQMKINAGG